MSDINIHIEDESVWEQKNKTYVRGSAFLDEYHLTTRELANRISDTCSKRDLFRLLTRLNGYYSIIRVRDGIVSVASDHLRTWPLFYSVTADTVYVSDSSYWIDQKAGDQGYDPKTATEYLFTLYSTGNETLNRNVKQILPGEVVHIDSKDVSPTPDRNRYFIFGPGSSENTISIESFDSIYVGAFKRFIEMADGRPILLALSEGIDSKQIALMLSRLDYDNVTAFTYGDDDGARELANDLGFEHIQIQVTRDEIRELYETEKWKSITESVGFLSSVPEFKQSLLFEKLSRHDQCPNDPIMTLGHTPLEKSGKPSGIENHEYLYKGPFLKRLSDMHYNRWWPSKEGHQEKIKPIIEGELLNKLPVSVFENSQIENIEHGIKAFECWYWQERTPKYLLSSQEADYANLPDRWFPKWDREVMNAVSKINYQDRIGRKFIKRYLAWLDEKVRGADADSYNTKKSSGNPNQYGIPDKEAIVQKFPDIVREPLVRNYKSRKSQRLYPYDSDSRYGLIPEKDMKNFNIPYQHPKTLWYLQIYRHGYFSLERETELDRAID